MKNKWKSAAVAGIMMLALQGLNAQYTGQVNFSPAEVNIEQANSWHIAGMAECTMETEPGKPYLPVKLLNIAIPADKTVTGIEILVKQQQELAGTYNIMPTQPGQIPGEPEPDFVGPDPGIYSTDAPWPAEFMYYTTSGFRSGVHIAGLLYYPLQFNPVTQKLYLTTHLEYRLIFADQVNNPVKPRRMAEHTLLKLKASIKGYVENPADVDNFLQLERIDQAGVTAFIPDEFPNFNGSAVEYVIITSQELAEGFQEIADWKTRKGVPAVVRTVEWIYSHYPGADQTEKVRNFIIDAYENWGIQYVMLGGDSDIVPIRYAWISHFNHGQLLSIRPFGEFIPADMYFTCLDGNWNADGDATYGEANWDRQNDGSFALLTPPTINIDQVDRLPEVYVGRMPVEDMEELNRWKVKYFEYVKGSDNNKNNALLFSADSDGINSYEMDMVDNVFPTFVTRTKLYEKDGFVNTDVYNHMNGSQGIDYHFISGYGHGGATSFEACVGNLDRIHMDNLSNSIRSQFLYLTHCSTMEYDKDCVTERYLNALNGGVGVIANTRFGWTGHPNRYTRPFVQELYNNTPIIGLTFNEIKTLFNSSTYSDGTRRWEFFALNLASDPELAFWTNNPQSLQVISPASVPTGQNNIQIEISNLATDVEAMICLYKEDEVYAREMVTGTGGTITANITCTPNTPGEILVTVTAKNYIPAEEEIQVTINPGTHLFASGYQINDSGSGQSNGNGNQLADAGETIELLVSVKNQGLTSASGVSGVLSSASPYITITGSQASYGNIASLGEVLNQLPFVFEVSVYCPKNQTAAFTLVLSDGLNNTYTSNFSLPLHAPDPALVQTILSTTINNDPIIDPGDVVSVLFTVYNPGNGPAMSLTGEITSIDPMVTGITSATQAFGDIEPFGSQENSNPFVFTVSQNYQGGPIELLLVITTSLGQEWEIPVVLDYPNVITGLDFIGYNTSIALTWDPVALAEAAGYNVYRSDTPDGTYVKLNNQIISGFSGYTDYGLAPVTTYYYKVAAVSSSGLVGHLTEPLTAWTTLAYHADWPMAAINVDDFGSRSEGSPNAMDINGDQTKEIFFTTSDLSGTKGGLFGFRHDMEELYDIDNNPTTTSGFYKYNCGGAMSIPAIGDLNNDGILEIVTTTKNGENGADRRRVIVHSTEDADNDGKPDLLWSSGIGGPDSRGACLADINGDGNLEILVKSDWGSSFQVFVNNGTYYPGWPVNNNKTGFTLPAACDLDDDGFKEIIFGCKEGIYIYSHNGQPFIASNPDGLFFNYTQGSGYDRMDAAPVFIDLSGDGYLDMIWVSGRVTGGNSAEGRVFALDRFGNFINSWGYDDHIVDLTFLMSDILWLPSPAVGYVDYNGTKQLVVTIAEKGKIYCWDAFGNSLDNFPVEVQGLEAKFISPLIADVDEDDALELIVASNSVSGGIFAFKFDGTPVVGWPLRVKSFSTPFISDINNDGKNEIIAMAEMVCHVWSTTGDADKVEWGSFRRDTYNSGIYDNICRYNAPPMVIAENTIWTENKKLSGNLIIASNASLTVKSTVEMPTNTKIIVESGSILTIDGGIVTSQHPCYEPWQGIEVWGNPTLQSIEAYQGAVFILNEGTIENAIVGIRTVKTLQAGDGEELVEYNYAGGIVKSVNGRFINNQAAVRFYKYPATGYSHVNTSFFNGTLFETNEDYFGATNPGPFAYLDNINMVKFNVCEFVNNLGTSNQQTGLYSLNSQFLVNGFESGNNLQYTLFKDLWYGIYATANNPSRFADIRLTKFDLCHRGLYISGMTNARITSNQFNTNAHYKPLPLGGYGMYLNNSTGYWVEDNDYYHEGPTQVGIGIIVHNSGSAPNEIYNNRFTNLTMGVSAQEHNGNVFTTAGLQILCNDFVQCAADILVPRPGRPEWGIARNQGANSTDPVHMAGNLFHIPSPVPNGDFDDINNQGIFVNYYYPENTAFDDVEPVDYTQNTVLPIEINNSPIWTPETGCPSGIETGGGGEDPRTLMAESQQKIDSTETLLTMLVDGGNTQDLQTEVAHSFPPEAMAIYTELIDKSPYLSDTVVSTAIGKENVLVDAMIRDVMVANPHSAKNEELLNKLDDRWTPLPEYMVEQVLQGRNLISVKEKTESQLARFMLDKTRAMSRLERAYRSDTANMQSSLDSLAMLYAADHTPESKYRLAFLQLERGEAVQGQATLNSIPSQFTLRPGQVDEHAKLVEYYSLLVTFAGSAPDSAAVQALYGLSQQEPYHAAMYATNMLIALGEVQYEEPVIMPDYLKSARASGSQAGVDKTRKPQMLKVKPNPAKDFMIVEYELETGGNILIEVTDVSGKPAYSVQAINTRDEVTIDTRNWTPGAHIVTLKLNGKPVESVKFTKTQ